MALIHCPECGNEISNRASACIYCGFPISDNLRVSVVQNKQKKKRKQNILIVGCVAFAIIVFAVFVLTDTICLNHSWSEATMLEPKICSNCGKTNGKPKPLEVFDYPSSGLASLLPIPESNMGEVVYDSSSWCNILVGETSASDYFDYVSACADIGFDIDYQRNKTSYHAYDIAGNSVWIWYRGNDIMELTVYAADEQEIIDEDDANYYPSDSTTTYSSNETDYIENYCDAGGCSREGTRTYIGFSGATEHYCSEHYNEMMDMMNEMGFNDTSDDYGQGYGYDSSDPYYSANDYNNDGLLTDEEWQDAMSDALADYWYLFEG